MQYRPFGKTGIKVSALGFGAMRLPKEDEQESIRLLRLGFELGINYVDTAPGYLDGLSEVYVGKALKGGWRERVYLSTKNPIENASGTAFRQRLEQSLKRLDVDYIDFYHFWGINWQLFQEKINVPHGPLDAALRAKDEGLIRFLSFSFHDAPENLLKLVDTGLFASVLCQYNLLDQANEAGIAHAAKQGLGVAIMGPVAGGRLGAPSPQIQALIPGGVKSTAEAALRFVLANPHVSLALSGMNTEAMIRENVAVASRTDQLSPAERERIVAMIEENKRLADLYCTGCKYCLPCPHGVNIPEVFLAMNYHRVYGLTDFAQGRYRELVQKKEDASQCIACGVCEKKCPQRLPIRAKLRETAATLAPAADQACAAGQ